MFTDQEKLEVLKWPTGAISFANGLREVSAIANSNGHSFPGDFGVLAEKCANTWSEIVKWFADLSGSPSVDLDEPRDRAVVVVDAKSHYDTVLLMLNDLITASSSRPEFAKAKDQFEQSLSHFTGFDWSLPYTDPRHVNVPSTPFDESKTVIGPHGDWLRAMASLRAATFGLGDTLLAFAKIVKSAPSFPSAANFLLRDQLKRFANMMDTLTHAWVMHVEVEMPEDKRTIDADVSASPPTRSRRFLVTLLQTEYLLNVRQSHGLNWRGRYLKQGFSLWARSIYSQRMIAAIALTLPDKGKDWVKFLMLGEDGKGNGINSQFINGLTGFWQDVDGWAQAAFGFFHPLPDPNEFTPSTGGVPLPTGNTAIPSGFFDSEEAELNTAIADANEIDQKLGNVSDMLTSKIGTTI